MHNTLKTDSYFCQYNIDINIKLKFRDKYNLMNASK